LQEVCLQEWLRVQRGLLSLTADKLELDMAALEKDDTLFSHAVDEVLSFARDQHVQEAVKQEENPRWPVAVITQESVCQR